MTVGERIKKIRQNNSISQTELANACKISKQNLYKYENNIITNIPSDKIELIADYFSVSPAYLMGWSAEVFADEILNSNSNSLSLNPDEDKLISNYRLLNDSGKEKLLEYSEDLIGNAKYTTPDIKEKHA